MTTKQYLLDAHHHFWDLHSDDVHYPWLTDNIVEPFFLGDYTSIRKPFFSTQLQQLTPPGYHLLGSVHCEAEARRSDALAETQWLNQQHQQTTLPTALVGWVDFMADDCAQQLDQQMQSPLFRGVRAKPTTADSATHALQHKQAPGSLQDRQWQRGLALLQEHQLSWDLRVPAWHLEEAAEVLTHYPDLTVIINHCGLPWDRSDKGLEQWQRGIHALANNPRVCVKLSELSTPNSDWNAENNKKLLCQLITIMGADRCLFASNAPVSNLQVSYADWLSLVEQAIAISAPEARDNILWRNAVRWYRLTDINKNRN